MAKTILWHNPRCSKSREALSLLQESGVDLEVRNYLEDPPSADELRTTLGLLGMNASELARRGEAVYRELELADADDAIVLEAMVKHPILIERPIVVSGGRAVVARPPSRAKDVLK